MFRTRFRTNWLVLHHHLFSFLSHLGDTPILSLPTAEVNKAEEDLVTEQVRKVEQIHGGSMMKRTGGGCKLDTLAQVQCHSVTSTNLNLFGSAISEPGFGV